MADESWSAKEIEKELIGEKYIPKTTLKPVPDDPQRTTKQMHEQFIKIKQGLDTDLELARQDYARANERVRDLENALKVIQSGIAMLS